MRIVDARRATLRRTLCCVESSVCLSHECSRLDTEATRFTIVAISASDLAVFVDLCSAIELFGTDRGERFRGGADLVSWRRARCAAYQARFMPRSTAWT